MAKSLDDRISAAMGNGARAATVQELIDELDTVISNDRDDRDVAQKRSISATVSEEVAEAAADDVARLDRRIIRMTGKREALATRLEELLTSERRRALEAEHTEARDERDKLAAELAEWWPQMQGAMIELLARLDASDKRCAQVNQRRAFGLPELASAEIEARGCTGMYFHPQLLGLNMASIKEIKFPHFHASEWGADGALAWPPKEPPTTLGAGSEEMFAALERAHKARREYLFPGSTKAQAA